MLAFSMYFRGLRGKLLLLTFIPMVLMGGLSFFAYHVITQLSHDVDKAANVRAPIMRHAADMQTAVNGIARWMWSTYVIGINEVEARNRNIAGVHKEVKRFEAAHEAYMKLPRSDRMKVLYQPVEEAWPKADEAIHEVLGSFEKHSERDNEVARELMFTKLRPLLIVMGDALDKMADERQVIIKAESDAEVAEAQNDLQVFLLIAITGSVVLLLFGSIVSSRLSKTLSHATQKIADVGDQVQTASHQLSESSQQASNGSTEAASSLEETVSSLEELSSMVKLNADNSKEAASLSQTSRHAAEEGESEIRSLIEAMRGISQSSKKIEEIINVIDDIAFQTNLLALNAAVEAARAGEQGKGFAVVAEAVRNLAQRSASAAKDINVMIKDSVEQIDRGTHIADQSGEVLKNIVTSVKKVADLNNEIASASQEQANGLSQINKAMSQLDQATQANAASAEEVASSSEEMSSQATVLQGLVSELNRVITGGSGENYNYSASVQTHRHDAAPKRPSLKVVGGKAHAKFAGKAEKVIPFDDHQEHDKVGTIDGF